MNSKQILNALRSWHRTMGLFAALFVICLAVTGVLLQHANDFGLDKYHVKNALVLKWYGIKPDEVVSYQAGSATVSHAGSALYLNTQKLQGHYNDLKGVVTTPYAIVVVSDEALIFFSSEGQLLDKLTQGDGLADTALGIALSGQGRVIMRGLKAYWLLDESGVSWKRYQGEHPIWSTPVRAANTVLQTVRQRSVEDEISIERLLMDVHSGRLFGYLGAYIMDLAALAMLFLAVSGVYMWTKNGKNGKRK